MQPLLWTSIAPRFTWPVPVRREALQIRGTNCEACGQKPRITLREVEVHHTHPLADNGPTRTDVNTDVLVLCRICHARAHKNGNKELLGLEELSGVSNDEKAEEFEAF
jgi:predicted HNH restriction endonuclease